MENRIEGIEIDEVSEERGEREERERRGEESRNGQMQIRYKTENERMYEREDRG